MTVGYLLSSRWQTVTGKDCAVAGAIERCENATTGFIVQRAIHKYSVRRVRKIDTKLAQLYAVCFMQRILDEQHWHRRVRYGVSCSREDVSYLNRSLSVERLRIS